MTNTFERRPTIVGVDGSPGSDQALDWAIDDASTRGRPLRIVAMYAWGLVTPFERNLHVEVPELGHLQAKAQRVVANSVAAVKSEHPDLEVTGAATESAIVDGLLHEAEGADVLVLGSHHLGPIGATVLGSTGGAVAARAASPVVIVREPGHSTRPSEVVIGVDGSDGSDAIIAFAFGYAQDHGLAVRAVLGWWPVIGLLPRVSEPVVGPAARWLEMIMSGWREKYPDVDVRTEVVEAHPISLLVERSRDQALVVVGSRGRHARAGTLLGSVSQGVLHHAHCPVAVVPVHEP